MSVELKQLKGELFREALLKGWYSHSLVPPKWGDLDADRVQGWFKRLLTAPEGLPPVGLRLVNHFSLGCDPEFKMFDGAMPVNANGFKLLKAGPAFGADNNGRLVEFRAHPSRTALGVLASLWLAIRWMGVFEPSVLPYTWRSGAYAEGDGLGGHIHFGRKRATLRDRELSALDHLTHLMFSAGIFDREEGRMRYHQSQGGHYGNTSDYRPQRHGWEYRTLPSWLDGPWLSYFCLTLAKVVVAMAELVPPLAPTDHDITCEQARGRLRLILAYFSPLDDDARLAFAILNRRGFPCHISGTDLKSNWGIFIGGPLGQIREGRAVDILPSSIPPTALETSELAQAMFEGRSPDLTPLRPTWEPHVLPKGYVQCIRLANTHVAPGVGEFCMDLCYHKDQKFTFSGLGPGKMRWGFPESHRGHEVLGRLFQKLDYCRWQEVPSCMGLNFRDCSPEVVAHGKDLILKSQAFPIWRISDVTEHSYEDWVKASSSPQAPKAPEGLLFQS